MQQNQPKKNMKETEFFTEYGDANRYRILEIIGKGSYGVVCAAIDTHTGEKVAIKKITNIFEHMSDAIRILREVKLLRLLRHPDIVEIKRIMVPPSRREFRDIYVVFELMESDLHQVIKANDDLTREHKRFFLYQMLRALKYMHTANVYHRDLKPKNILANANCKLKICDFGLARVAFSDTPTTTFWTDYVATRWYRAPELCGSFFSKYTPAIDIWSIGCIFAEVLTGKPLFPGKSVVHQLEIITDLLGKPSADTIAGVRNDKARKFLTDMRRKQAVRFADKFVNADPLALELLQKLLAFDPKDRPTAEEALAHPYFKGMAKVDREPSCVPISKLEFEFERRRLTKEDIRELIFREILEYHPQMLKDYLAGNDGANFVYPSAVGHFRKQFAYLEENSSKNGPVIPPERKHLSLPRSTVNSSTIPVKSHTTQSAFDKQHYNRDVSGNARILDSMSGNPLKTTLPPVPAAKSGRAVGPVIPYENSRNINDAYSVIYSQNAVVPRHSVPLNCSFKPDPEKSQDKHNTVVDREDEIWSKVQHQQYLPAKARTLTPDVNYHGHHLYYHTEAKTPQLNNHIAIDAKFLQAQAQLGAVEAAAVNLAAHREVSAVQCGLT